MYHYMYYGKWMYYITYGAMMKVNPCRVETVNKEHALRKTQIIENI